MRRPEIAILLAIIAGWYLRILAEMDNGLFEGMISMIGFLILLLLFGFVSRGKP